MLKYRSANLLYRDIYLKNITKSSVGVFTKIDRKKGDVIEYVPYVPSESDVPSRFSQHIFYNSLSQQWILLLGYANYYSIKPIYNAEIIFPDQSNEDPIDQFVSIIAVDDIAAHDEICLNPNSFEMPFPEQAMTCYQHLYLDASSLGGRGVFAGKEFQEGDIVEVAPYIKDPFNKAGTGFNDITFASGIKNDSDIVVMGYGSLYNHVTDFNVRYQLYSSSEYYYYGTQFFVYLAVRSISKNEELLINYGDPYWEEREIKLNL